MSFPTAEEILKTAIPADIARKSALNRIVDDYLDTQKGLFYAAAEQGRFSVKLLPPSKELMDKVTHFLGETEDKFILALVRRLKEFGYGYHYTLNDTVFKVTVYWEAENKPVDSK
jgi:hypothetical protein